MKSTRKVILGIAAVASLGIAAAVYAEAGPGFGHGAGHCPGAGVGAGPTGAGGPGARGPAAKFDPAARVDARMAYLKSALKITQEQEPAWTSYVSQVKQQVDAMHGLRTAAVQNATLSAPERMAQHTALMQQRLASMQTLQGAMQGLYSALTTEQKALADDLLGKPGMGFGRHGR